MFKMKPEKGSVVSVLQKQNYKDLGTSKNVYKGNSYSLGCYSEDIKG